MPIGHPACILLPAILVGGVLVAEDAVPAAPLALTTDSPFKAVEAAVDLDHDGVFSPAEIGAMADPDLRGKLRAFDLDGDGALSEGETVQARKAWRGDRPARGKKGKQPEVEAPAP